MLKQIRPAIMMIVVMTVITGLIYPLGMTGIAQIALPESGERQPDRAGRQGHRLDADRPEFRRRQVFPRPRPSATTEPDPKDPTKTVPVPYAADNSVGSNLGPTAQPLVDRVKDDAAKLHEENPNAPVPVDLVTTSASGLDPDITPAGALFQVPRVAKARGLAEDRVRQLVADNTQGPPSRRPRRAACQCAEAQSRAGRARPQIDTADDASAPRRDMDDRARPRQSPLSRRPARTRRSRRRAGVSKCSSAQRPASARPTRC